MDIIDGQIAALIAELDRPDKPAIRAAVDALIALAADDPQLREILDRRLVESGHKNYWPAAFILGHLPQVSDNCLTQLLAALDHHEPDIRWAMALLLVRIAKNEIAVVNLLNELAATGTTNQKRMALYCLRDLTLSDPTSLGVMLKALGDTDPTVRVAAAICLKLRPDLDATGKTLLLRIYGQDRDPRVRNAVAITLASLGSASEELVDALKRGMESADQQTRKAAGAALGILEKSRPASSGRRSDR